MAIISPIDLGFPISRTRQFSVLALKNSCYMAEGLDKFFVEFGRRVVGPASIMHSAPEDYDRSVMNARAALRGYHGDPSMYPPIDTCLSAFQRRHLSGYMSTKDQYKGLDDSYYFDVEQNPHYGSRGAFLPCLLTHGFIVDASGDIERQPKLLGGLHHLAMQGVSVWGKMHNDDYAHIGTDFASLVGAGELSEGQAKKIAGNAIFEPLLGSLLFFIVGNVVMTDSADSDSMGGTTLPLAQDSPVSRTAESGGADGEGESDPVCGLPDLDQLTDMSYAEFKRRYGHILAAEVAKDQASSAASSSPSSSAGPAGRSDSLACPLASPARAVKRVRLFSKTRASRDYTTI